jgi:hypothetical protein
VVSLKDSPLSETAEDAMFLACPPNGGGERGAGNSVVGPTRKKAVRRRSKKSGHAFFT